MRKLLDFWRNLTRRQQIIIITSAVVTILGLFFFTKFFTKPKYATLYTELSPQELSQITNKLKEWGYSYLIDKNAIKVPAIDKDRLRLRLATEGVLPEGGLVGFEIFDKTKLTLTDFERQINYRRALEGELTRAIETIEAVERARVFVTLPKKELYTEAEIPPTASIKLKLKPYQKLTPSQVKGIVNLTAYAVEGLNPENVMVVDDKGNILSEDIIIGDNPHGEGVSLAAKQLEIQNYEAKLLEKKIKDKLSKVVGLDKVEVFVKWEMNFDRVEKKAVKYSMPGYEQLKLREEKLDEELKGEAEVPGGPPGMEAQMPTYKGIKGFVGPLTYKRTEQKLDYLADKTEEVYVRSPALAKISVAVFVDGTYERDAFGRLKRDKEGKVIYKPRTAEEMKKFEDIVWAAIGAQKGKEYLDKEYIVTVRNVQFDRTAEWALELKEEQLMKRNTRMIFGIIGTIGLVALVCLLFILLRLGRRRLPEEAIPAPVLPPVAPAAVEEVPERIRLLQEAQRIAKEKPRLVAELVRTWLAEE